MESIYTHKYRNLHNFPLLIKAKVETCFKDTMSRAQLFDTNQIVLWGYLTAFLVFLTKLFLTWLTHTVTARLPLSQRQICSSPAKVADYSIWLLSTNLPFRLLTWLTQEQQSRRGYYLLGWPPISSHREVTTYLADHKQQLQRGYYLLGWPTSSSHGGVTSYLADPRAAVTKRLLLTWLTHEQQPRRGYYLVGWPTSSSHGGVTTNLADSRAAVTERLLLTWLTHVQQSQRGYYFLG
jgi:hypothetical protein